MSQPKFLQLNKAFDCVVMLTWSDWKTETRSNRFHYATRMATLWPVLFVQPDVDGVKATVEDSGSAGIRLVHVSSRFDWRQAASIATTLNELGYRRPLLWVYNVHFREFIAACYSPLKVYHATEDYFVKGDVANDAVAVKLRAALRHIDLVVAVSESVRRDYIEKGGYRGDSLMLSNGCDYAFWSAPTGPAPHRANVHAGNIAFYQGGINLRLDFDLLEQVIGLLPDWEFRFCGRLDRKAQSRWKRLQRYSNLRYLGALAPVELRSAAREAHVGLIPFVESEMIDVLMPLKAFEYAACSLPVVSTPIKALAEHPELFRLARGPAEFSRAIKEARDGRFDEKAIAIRHNIARQYDYDKRFAELQTWMARFYDSRRDAGSVCDILVLYDAHSTHVSTVVEHLRSFSLYSRHRVRYAAATGFRMPAADFSAFDAVVIHYSIRINVHEHLSPGNVRALREFPGLKVLFIQDEYDTTETARRAIEHLGIHVVYTCVPQAHIETIYPPHRFPSVEFVPTLTGFAPIELPQANPPLRQRRLLIGYRGRNLPYWYGDLAREKLVIGQRMKEICTARGLPTDIEWDEAHRIYGENWYRFLQDCRATIGTESGSNLIDDYGHVRAAVEQALRDNPVATYEQLRPALIAPHESKILMNQASPKIFEAIACGTALVLFEGEYSGVVKPGLHFIPLKKDFSNVDEVFAKLQDIDGLTQLTERAYRDVIESGRYTYRAFVGRFDEMIGLHIRIGSKRSQQNGAAARQQVRGRAPITDTPLAAAALPAVLTSPRDWVVDAAFALWYRLPVSVRKSIRPLLNRIRSKTS